MKQLLQHDFVNTLGIVITAASVGFAKAAAYTPSPPTWGDVGFGALGGLLGAIIMIRNMPGLRSGRTPADLFFLAITIAALAGLASAFTAVLMLERLGLMYLWGWAAIALGGAFSAMGGVLTFPILAKLMGWASRHIDDIADAFLKRWGGGK